MRKYFASNVNAPIMKQKSTASGTSPNSPEVPDTFSTLAEFKPSKDNGVEAVTKWREREKGEKFTRK